MESDPEGMFLTAGKMDKTHFRRISVGDIDVSTVERCAYNSPC